eukprot:gene11093-12261_t
MATFLDDAGESEENKPTGNVAFEEANSSTALLPREELKNPADPVDEKSDDDRSTAQAFDANQHPPDLFTGTFQEDQTNVHSSIVTTTDSSHVYLSSSNESKFLHPEDMIKQDDTKKPGDELHPTNLSSNVVIEDNAGKQSLSNNEEMQLQTNAPSVNTSQDTHIAASEAANIAANLQSIDAHGQIYQQQPTYVLLQTGGDQESGGQPQVFLAMQTAGVTSADSQAYITLHPVSVDGQDLSGAFTAEGLNLQHAVLTQGGLSNDVSMDINQQHISIGDIKGLPITQGIDVNSQMYVPSAGQIVAAGDTADTPNAGVITYIQPINSLTGGQAQVLMAVAEDESQNARDASHIRTKRSLSTSNSNLHGQDSPVHATKATSNVSSQSRRRLSNDPRTCDECGRSFKYPSDLKKHLQIHTDMKKFQCDECCRCFRRLHQLNVHKRIHSGEKPYVCNRCGAEFRHDSTLTMHIRTRHDHLKPFSCDGCGKNFGRMSHLRKHQRNVCGKGTQRTNIFACKYCEKSFSRKADLRQHFASCEKKPENPEKPEMIAQASFPCEHCDKKFARNYDFKRHQLSHTDEKPFACSHCSKNFKERSSLYKHMKRMHSLLTGDSLMEGTQDESIDDAAQRAIAAITATSDDVITSVGNNPANIIVSLSHEMHSDSDGTIATAHALAQAGIIENADQILQGSHTIAAADILNFPEVAAALAHLHIDTDGLIIDTNESVNPNDSIVTDNKPISASSVMQDDDLADRMMKSATEINISEPKVQNDEEKD